MIASILIQGNKGTKCEKIIQQINKTPEGAKKIWHLPLWMDTNYSKRPL